MSGDEAWQHSGIGRHRLLGDERDADAGKRSAGEGFEHKDVGVPATHEDQVF
jgi:hypothetical protein